MIMIKKKKNIIVFLIIMAMLAVGCGRNTDVPESENTEPSADITEYGGESDLSRLKIALIDTGIVNSAIGSKNILPGYNYCSDTEATEDTIGHGTALASIILGSEAAGIEAVSPGSYVVPLVCQQKDENGNIQKVDIERLAEIIKDAANKYDCKIINISAGVKTDDERLREAVQYVSERGVLVIASAGNEGNSDIYYPGGYEEVLCVGSTNKEMTEIAEFSQKNDAVDIFVQGEDITVATMKGNPMKVSGTSYSAAYVTALAARLWQENPEFSASQIIQEIKDNKDIGIQNASNLI